MKVFLLHRDRDFAVKAALRDEIFEALLSSNPFAVGNVRRERERAHSKPSPPSSDDVLSQDLELDTLFGAMAAGDEFLFETARLCVLTSLDDPEAIVYRQQVLTDCLGHPAVVREIFALATEALEAERTAGGFWHSDRPGMILNRSVQVLTRHVDVLRRLRRLADEHAHSFSSPGFTRFFATLVDELSDEYLEALETHLKELKFERGLLQSGELGKGNKGRRYVVRRLRQTKWTERLPFANRPASRSFTIAPRDDGGFRALDEIRGKGINRVADVVARSADHVKSFFVSLRLELAFYLGCLNLHARLTEKGEPLCLPTALPRGETAHAAEGIYDVCLTLHLEDRVVGNDLHADGKALVMITGANQGGKSTLLRGVGLAQLMMQSGMFVGAESLRAAICSGVFTHYKREEDATMEGGKLDEELSRMSDIADEITPDALLLCNESFAATNEREGSEIARQVLRAMLDRRIRVLFVTHMYDLAHGFQDLDSALFLRAERQPDGRRTFKVREAEPLATSFGEDSYRRIFGTTEGATSPA
jgi:DNA mismatch repair ATPase MutS